MAGGKKSEEELNYLVDKIVADADGDDHQLWAFRQAFDDEIAMPADAFVLGEPATVLEIDYDGNERRGLTAKLRREDDPNTSYPQVTLSSPRDRKGPITWPPTAHGSASNRIRTCHWPGSRRRQTMRSI